MAVRAAISAWVVAIFDCGLIGRFVIARSYRAIRVPFAVMWKERIISLIGLSFPGYPQFAARSSP
jgi:hypothetical protein